MKGRRKLSNSIGCTKSDFFDKFWVFLTKSNLVSFSKSFILLKVYEDRYLTRFWVGKCAPCALNFVIYIVKFVILEIFWVKIAPSTMWGPTEGPVNWKKSAKNNLIFHSTSPLVSIALLIHSTYLLYGIQNGRAKIKRTKLIFFPSSFGSDTNHFHQQGLL